MPVRRFLQVIGMSNYIPGQGLQHRRRAGKQHLHPQASEQVEQITGRKIPWEYRNEPRKGDHICHISDLRKLRAYFPNWQLTYNLKRILGEFAHTEQKEFDVARESDTLC